MTNGKAASTIPLYSKNNMLMACLGCVILGVLIGAISMFAGWRYLKRTTNPLSGGWSIIEQGPTYDSCGGDAPADLNFMDDKVQVTTLSGEDFESHYELVPPEGMYTEYGKAIVIHDYLGREGCDVKVNWSMQPLAHISYSTIGEDDRLDIISGEDGDDTSVEYIFCG